MIPKVDTFEHDISDEIRRKEASLTEISAASNDVGNNDDIELPKKQPIFIIALVIFFVISIAGIGTLGYFYYADTQTIETNTAIVNSQKQKLVPANLEKMSPVLASTIGRFVTSVDKKEKGYVLTINDYPQVFAYMTRHENEFIEDFAALFQPSTSSSTNEAPQVKTVEQEKPAATTTPSAIAQATSTTKATSTGGTSKTTTASSAIPVILQPVERAPLGVAPSKFSDITISNQNMRVWTSDTHKVFYAFIGDKAVVISDSSEGILYLKSAILK